MSRQKKQSNKDSGFINESSLDESHIDEPMQNHNDKVQLTELNDRLANYIQHVQKKELDKEVLKTFEEISQVPKTQLDNLKELYEKELVSYREALDHESNELAKMTVKHDKLGAENLNLKSDLEGKSSKIGQLTDKLDSSEKLLLEAQNRILGFEAGAAEHSKLRDQLLKCQEQLEREVLMRTAAENACMTLKEKMRFDENVFEKELGAIMTTNRNTIMQMSNLNDTRSDALMDQLTKSREELMRNLKDLSDKFNSYFVERLKDSADNVLDKVQKVGATQKTKDELRKENADLKSELEVMSAMYIKLEDQMSQKCSEENEQLRRLNKQFNDLFQQNCDNLESLMQRYFNILDPLGEKIIFDAELNQYRRMLDDEEERTKRKFVSKPQVPLAKKPRLAQQDKHKECIVM